MESLHKSEKQEKVLTRQPSQNLITNNFLDLSESTIELLKSILSILTLYDSNVNFRNFNLEMDFELTRINIRFLESVISTFTGEGHKIKMLKLYDFISYEFKRLRNKYEEINEIYFSLDEENKYVASIKSLMSREVIKPSKLGCCYLRLLNHYLNKVNKRLNSFTAKNFITTEEEKEKFIFANCKVNALCKMIYHYLYEDTIISSFDDLESKCRDSNYTNSSDILKFAMSDFNGVTFEATEYNKWSSFIKITIQNALLKLNSEKSGKKRILSFLKNGVSMFFNMINTEKDQMITPNINLIKSLFEAFETKLTNCPSGEVSKVNELVYLQKKGLDNFKLLNEKEAIKRKLKNLIKLRIVTNQLVKINYDYQSLFEKREACKYKEFNFFGLLLRVSKEFLTPTYNVILHIPGGGFLSQSSSSHLNYLSNWAKVTDSVIITLDYKLSAENKYPILLDECISAYESIINHSAKLFNFNINKLIIYSDSVGSLITFDIIKHSINNKLRIPEEVICVFPCCNLLIDETKISKSIDPLSFLGLDDNLHEEIIDLPFCCKFAELFIPKEGVDHNDDRLNFFLTDGKIVRRFPQSLIISSGNEPIREDCRKLADFLRSHGVSVLVKNSIYYSHGFLQIPSLFDPYNNTLNFILQHIVNSFGDKSNYKSNSTSDSTSGKSTLADLGLS